MRNLNLKKIGTLLTSLVTIGMLTAIPVHAQGATPEPVLVPTDKLTGATFDAINPLKLYGDQATAQQLSTPGGIISRFLVYAFPIAGLILFVMIIWGGFEILVGATDKKSIDTGKQRVTAALVGFILLFASYWIAQVVQVVFGLKFL
jgi:hypothetical protein